jgi:uncharacterized phage-associated protein
MPTTLDVTALARLVVDELGGVVDTLKLQKLVYYCQAWHVTAFGTPLHSSRTEAWQRGPVARSLWPQHRGQYKVRAEDLAAPSVIPDEQSTELVRGVVAYYRPFSGEQLEEMTHREAPWLDVFQPNQNREITLAAMQQYYSAVLVSGGQHPQLPASSIRYSSTTDHAAIRRAVATAAPGRPSVPLLDALRKARSE